MQNPKQDAGELKDLVIDANSDRIVERPKKLQSMIDTQAMRFLEAMDFQSYEDLSGAFRQFMMDAPLFQGDVAFSRAALALDLTAQLFSTIDRDKNHLLSREEFAYLLLKTTEANRQALSWLIENFHAFTQACFFKDQIAKDDIEAARNVFHGLKIAQEKFGFNKQPTLENLQELDAAQIKDFLEKNRAGLTPHEASGLVYLLDHIKTNVNDNEEAFEDSETKTSDKLDNDVETGREDGLKKLDGIVDKQTLHTLRALKLNNFESLWEAFAAFLEDPAAFRGDTPFVKAENALDASANILSELEMDSEHPFTRSEVIIVGKLSGSKDKKQLKWFARFFDALTKTFFLPGKTKKKDLFAARNIFGGLSFVRENFDCESAALLGNRQDLNRQIKLHLQSRQHQLEERHKRGLEELVRFMEEHAR